MARLIDADEFRQWWLENGENEYVYDTNSVLDSIDNWPTVTLSQEPLTLEQLRKMDGKPYWHVGLQDDLPKPHWKILPRFVAQHPEDYEYGKTWLAYPYPLPHIDRETWICGICEVPSHWAKWGNLGYRYCPHCGRPLTEEAWAELERRLRK